MTALDSELPTGQLFADRYLVTRLLGDGGMGKVYLVSDTLLGNEQIALKILHADLTRDEKQTKRFLREVQLTRKVSHPNIVRTFDVGTWNGALYFTMEYAPGVTLKEEIAKGPLEYQKAAVILAQICRGLAAIHQAEIIHRDLKPGNVIISPQSEVKITDFGVARTAISDVTAHNEVVGSVAYMSPEVWSGKEIGPCADIYSLGVLAYEAVTGVLPFEANSAAELMFKHLELKPDSPLERAPRLPFWFAALIMRMLHKSPQQRPQSAAEIAEQIEQKIAAESTVASEAPESPAKNEPAILSGQAQSSNGPPAPGQVFRDLLEAANRGEASRSNAEPSRRLGVVRQRPTLRQGSGMQVRDSAATDKNASTVSREYPYVRFLLALFGAYTVFWSIDYGLVSFVYRSGFSDSPVNYGAFSASAIALVVVGATLKSLLPVFCLASLRYRWSEIPKVLFRAFRLMMVIFVISAGAHFIANQYGAGHDAAVSTTRVVKLALAGASHSVQELAFMSPWPSLLSHDLLFELGNFNLTSSWRVFPLLVYVPAFFLYLYYVFQVTLGGSAAHSIPAQLKLRLTIFLAVYSLATLAVIYFQPISWVSKILSAKGLPGGLQISSLLSLHSLIFALSFYMLALFALLQQKKRN